MGVGLALAGTAISAAGAAYSGYSQAQAGKKQAAAGMAGAKQLSAAGKNLGKEYDQYLKKYRGIMEAGGEELAGITFKSRKEEGYGMANDALNWQRGQLDQNLLRTVGGEANKAQFEQLTSASARQANWDFRDIPRGVLETLKGSALSRAMSGPAGLAERFSVAEQMKLQQQGEQSMYKGFAFKQGFQPDVFNPIDTVYSLMNSERQRVTDRLNAYGMAADAEGKRYGIQTDRLDFQQGIIDRRIQNNPGVAQANANAIYGQTAAGVGKLLTDSMPLYPRTSVGSGPSQGSGGYGYGPTESSYPTPTFDASGANNPYGMSDYGPGVQRLGKPTGK